MQQKNPLFRKKVPHLLFQPKIAENGREKISGLFRQMVRLLPICDFIQEVFVELNSDCGFFNKPPSSNHEARVVNYLNRLQVEFSKYEIMPLDLQRGQPCHALGAVSLVLVLVGLAHKVWLRA